jgi:hypothetical protein
MPLLCGPRGYRVIARGEAYVRLIFRAPSVHGEIATLFRDIRHVSTKSIYLKWLGKSERTPANEGTHSA